MNLQDLIVWDDLCGACVVHDSIRLVEGNAGFWARCMNCGNINLFTSDNKVTKGHWIGLNCSKCEYFQKVFMNIEMEGEE